MTAAETSAGEEDARAGGRQPVEGEDGRLGRGSGRRAASRIDQLDRRAGTAILTSDEAVQKALDLRNAPQKHQDAQDQPGHPGPNIAPGVPERPRRRPAAVRGLGCFGPVSLRSPSQIFLGCQTRRKSHQRRRWRRPTPPMPASQGPWKLRDQELGDGEGHAGDRRPARPPASPRSRQRPRSARRAR